MKKTITIQGRVVAGRRLGRTLGFPTANVHLPIEECQQLVGVWFARVVLSEELGQRHWALVNVGRRPTVESHGMCKLEAWVIGFEGNLYDQEIVIDLVEYLRKERKFDSLEQLQQAINEDKKQAFKIIANDEYIL